MKILLILLSVASSLPRFVNLRRNGFYNHHRAGNNFRRSSQSPFPIGVRQVMNNKSERPVKTNNGILHDAAEPEVINKLIMANLLRMDRDTFNKYNNMLQYATNHENQFATK